MGGHRYGVWGPIFLLFLTANAFSRDEVINSVRDEDAAFETESGGQFRPRTDADQVARVRFFVTEMAAEFGSSGSNSSGHSPKASAAASSSNSGGSTFTAHGTVNIVGSNAGNDNRYRHRGMVIEVTLKDGKVVHIPFAWGLPMDLAMVKEKKDKDTYTDTYPGAVMKTLGSMASFAMGLDKIAGLTGAKSPDINPANLLYPRESRVLFRGEIPPERWLEAWRALQATGKRIAKRLDQAKEDKDIQWFIPEDYLPPWGRNNAQFDPDNFKGFNCQTIAAMMVRTLYGLNDRRGAKPVGFQLLGKPPHKKDGWELVETH